MKQLLQRFRVWREGRTIERLTKHMQREALARKAAEPVPPARKGINLQALAKAMEGKEVVPQQPAAHESYKPPKGVVPSGMAMDYDCTDYAYLNAIPTWSDTAFRGYQYLSFLAQRPEYRKITETIAEEATRKWIKITSTGDVDLSDKVEKLTKAMETFKLREVFRAMSEMDGFYGRGQLYVNVLMPGGASKLPASADDEEVKTLLLRDPAKVKKGGLLGFVPVEPVWTYPGKYNSDKPLQSDFYVPQVWYVMGQQVHRSRLLTFIAREVPDLLKASYNFGGLSMSQMSEPYVNNWLRTRDSVSDLVHSFSLTQLATNMDALLTDGDDGGDFYMRLRLMNEMKDNRGILATNKDTEEINQFNTPLGGLDKLQAQAQEQMATPAGIPLVKFFGITPSGLNASSDGEVRVFYDRIASYQTNFMRPNLSVCLDFIQLNEFGEIDENIGFEFEPLWQPDAIEAATIRKTDAETDTINLTNAAITPEEIRDRLLHDPSNVYHSLDDRGDVSDDFKEDAPEPAPGAALPGQPAKPAAPAKEAAEATT